MEGGKEEEWQEEGEIWREAAVFSLKLTEFSEEDRCIISAEKYPDSVVLFSPSQSCLFWQGELCK